MAETRPPADIEKLRAQLRHARGIARGPASAVSSFHATDDRVKDPAVSKKPDAAVPQKPAPPGSSISPYGPTQYVEPAKGPRPPQPAAKSAATAVPASANENPVDLDPVTDIGFKFFGMRVSDLRGVIGRNKAEIRKRFPAVPKVKVTLMLKEGVYSVVKYDPPELKPVLHDKFDAVLKEMARDTREHKRTYRCTFDYTLQDAFSMTPVQQPRANPRATVELLGPDGAAFAAAGAPPELMDTCNYHLLPGPAGYLFMLPDKDPTKNRKVYYEVKLAKKDDFQHLFAVSKVVDGKRTQMQSIALDMTSENERFGFPDEGIEISFSEFKGGEKAMMVDRLNIAREAEPAATHSKDERAFVGLFGLTGVAGLIALPEIVGFLNKLASLTDLNYTGSVPESLTIGSHTIPIRQVLAVSAMTWLGVVAGVSKLCSRKKKGDTK